MVGRRSTVGNLGATPAGTSRGARLAPSAYATTAGPTRRLIARLMLRHVRRSVGSTCRRVGNPYGTRMPASAPGNDVRPRPAVSHESRTPVP